METLHIEHVNELKVVAENVLQKLTSIRREGKTPVLALSGDLGAGKTTFMQVLAKQLGVTDTVISPTYVIMKRYAVAAEAYVEVFKTLIHMDVYRIGDIAEMKPLRFDEVLVEPEALVCIEWAEKIKTLLPPHTLYMDMRPTGEHTRDITFSYHA